MVLIINGTFIGGKISHPFQQFIQPPGSAPTEVMEFSLPQYSIPWIRALAHYLRQNLLIFLHIPKYTDSNMEHHFKVTVSTLSALHCLFKFYHPSLVTQYILKNKQIQNVAW